MPVEAIHRADQPGTHWLECKSTLDFGPRLIGSPRRANIAFANRDPVSAGRDCGGEAYLVVGVAGATPSWRPLRSLMLLRW